MSTEKKVYSFRFDEKMILEIRKHAEKENRSLSNFMETILKNYLNQQSISKQ